MRMSSSISRLLGSAAIVVIAGLSFMSPTTVDAQTQCSGVPALGFGGSLNGMDIFNADSAWHQKIDALAVDPLSDTILSTVGKKQLHPDFGGSVTYGIPYVVVDGSTPLVPITATYKDESDPGPMPIPGDAPVEGGSDRHVLVLDRDRKRIYELFNAAKAASGGGWNCDSAAIFDLNSTGATRPIYWTSADAAGLSILAGLVRYDEVMSGSINHAIRFTLVKTRKAFVYPGRHFASSLTATNYAPMGARFRLKASVNISGYPKNVQVILKAMKEYGLIVSDNGGDFFFTGASDARWNDDELNTMKQLYSTDFELVSMGTNVVAADGMTDPPALPKTVSNPLVRGCVPGATVATPAGITTTISSPTSSAGSTTTTAQSPSASSSSSGVKLTGKIKLSGNSFQKLVLSQALLTALIQAIIVDLARLLNIPASAILRIKNISIGSLLFEYDIADSATPSAAQLETSAQGDGASSSQWTNLRSLYAANASSGASDTVAFESYQSVATSAPASAPAGGPAGAAPSASSNSSPCGDGCGLFIGVTVFGALLVVGTAVFVVGRAVARSRPPANNVPSTDPYRGTAGNDRYV